MSITDLRTAVTTAGGTPTRFDQVNLYRQLLTAWGGTPQSWTVPNLLRELIVKAGGTPTQWDQVGLLRQLVTARGGTPATYYPDALEAQVAALASLGPSYGPELLPNPEFTTDVSGYTFTNLTGVWNTGAMVLTKTADANDASTVVVGGLTPGTFRLQARVVVSERARLRSTAFAAIDGASLWKVSAPGTYDLDLTLTSLGTGNIDLVYGLADDAAWAANGATMRVEYTRLSKIL